MPKDKQMLLKLRGFFVDIMCQINPEYEKHVTELHSDVTAFKGKIQECFKEGEESLEEERELQEAKENFV